MGMTVGLGFKVGVPVRVRVRVRVRVLGFKVKVYDLALRLGLGLGLGLGFRVRVRVMVRDGCECCEVVELIVYVHQCMCTFIRCVFYSKCKNHELFCLGGRLPSDCRFLYRWALDSC